jgi:hypothetical protein
LTLAVKTPSQFVWFSGAHTKSDLLSSPEVVGITNIDELGVVVAL